MSDGAYQAAVVAARLAAQLLAEHDIPGLIARIHTADATGPLLNPTALHEEESMGKTDRVREYVSAAEQLHRFDPALNRLWDALTDTEKEEVRRIMRRIRRKHGKMLVELAEKAGVSRG